MRAHAGAASLTMLLLVALLTGAPSLARATTAPYALLGMCPGNDSESAVLGDPSAGAIQQVAPSPAMILTELPAFTQWAGKGNLIVNTYDYNLDTTVPSPGDGEAPNTLLADLNAIWAEGAVPMLSWGRGVDLINSGQLDSEI